MSEIKVNDEIFQSINEAAWFYKVDIRLVRERINRLNWTVEQALEIKSTNRRPYKTSLLINNQKFESINQAADYYGIARNTLRVRLRNGYSVEDATNTNFNEIHAKDTNRQSMLIRGNCKPFIISNKFFPTLLCVYRSIYFNVNYEAISDDLRSFARHRKKNDKLGVTLSDLCKQINCYTPTKLNEFDALMNKNTNRPEVQNLPDLTDWFAKRDLSASLLLSELESNDE